MAGMIVMLLPINGIFAGKRRHNTIQSSLGGRTCNLPYKPYGWGSGGEDSPTAPEFQGLPSGMAQDPHILQGQLVDLDWHTEDLWPLLLRKLIHD